MFPDRATRPWPRALPSVALLWLALCHGPILSSAATAPRPFDLPAGDAAQTLKQFALQARGEILFPAESVAGVLTRPVAGSYSPREAVDRMLAGTPLIVVEDARTGAFMITRRAGRPTPAPSPPPPRPVNSHPLSRLGTVLAATLAPSLYAATPATPAPPPVDEKVVQLSPFQVAADADRGYQALNTLSGTRINSKLEDLGASITVVTMQQLLDTASVDINDIFRYEASTEGTDNFTQFTPNRNGGVGDSVQQDPATANRIRGVGTAGTSGSGINVAFGNQSINNKIPVDIYNIDAVEISRGPNANLFGLGASAGTVNLVPSLANLHRATAAVTLRFDDWGGHRESLNLNRPILPGKLAFRLATVHESKGFTRQPASERINRLYATFTAQPFKNTTARASFERYDNFYRRPNSIMPRDTTSDWRAAGSPTWDPVTQLVTLGNGQKAGPFTVAQDPSLPPGLITGNAINGRLIASVDDGAVRLLTPARTGNLITTGTPSPLTQNSNIRYLETGTFLMRNKAALFPLFLPPAVRDQSIYDWSEINYVAANWGRDNAKTYSAELEQTFLRRPQHLLAGRIGWFQQDFTRDNHNFIDVTDGVIYVDVNERLLDGTPNPFFKRPYVESISTVEVREPARSDTQSADFAYQFTPAQTLPRWLSWINTQRLALHGETVRNRSVNYRYSPFIADDHAWVNRANRISGSPIVQRFYVGDSVGGNVDYGASPVEEIKGTYDLRWFNNLSPGAWTTEPAQIDMLQVTNTTAKRNELRTLNAVAQGFFFNDRLVATYGWRRDRRRERTSAGVAVDPATGLVSYDALGRFGPWTDDQGEATRASQRGDTKTWGAVVKPLPWLHFHYNQSDSFFPQVVRQRIDLEGNLSNPHGEGEDYGVSVSALQGKLYLRLNRFEVTEFMSRGSEAGTIGNRTFRLEGRQESNGRRDPESFYPWAEDLARTRFSAQGITNPSPAQLRPAVAKIMNVSESYLNIFLDSGLAQPQTVGTTDVTSKGYELEATYNPTRNWRLKFTGAQAVAYDQTVSPEIFDYWQKRLPTWTTVRGDLVPGSGDAAGRCGGRRRHPPAPRRKRPTRAGSSRRIRWRWQTWANPERRSANTGGQR
ncbi:MAG: hypothetical protein Q7S40_21695 [Opitutaceae bacterium]|nr:hypothetical protein [Opitutaceae bacterium]